MNRFYSLPDELQTKIFLLAREPSDLLIEVHRDVKKRRWDPCPFFTVLVTQTDMSPRDLTEYWDFMNWLNKFQPYLLPPDQEESEEEKAVHIRLDSELNRYLHIWENIIEHYYD